MSAYEMFHPQAWSKADVSIITDIYGDLGEGDMYSDGDSEGNM